MSLYMAQSTLNSFLHSFIRSLAMHTDLLGVKPLKANRNARVLLIGTLVNHSLIIQK